MLVYRLQTSKLVKIMSFETVLSHLFRKSMLSFILLGTCLISGSVPIKGSRFANRESFLNFR